MILILFISVSIFYANRRLQTTKYILPENESRPHRLHTVLRDKWMFVNISVENGSMNSPLPSGNSTRSFYTTRKRHHPDTSSLTTPHRLIARENLSASAAVTESTYRPTKKPEDKRRSLLIYGADRSGTTFTTKMFAEDPQLFTVCEPLWITSLWNREYPTEVSHWKRNVVDVLRGILGCKFADSQAGTKFLSYTDRQWSGAFVKNPFKSAAFCNGTCKGFSKNPEYVDEVCLSKFKHSVTKIGEPRVPDNLLSAVVPQVLEENPETDVRVIQLVRDPRGSFNSRIKLGWMEEYHHWDFPNTVRYQCSKLAQNIKFGRNLPFKWRVKYLEVHYQDLAKHPIETANSMYEFAGFQMSPKILDWVRKNTSPSKEELLKEKEDIYSSVRNSSAIADYWTQEAPINRTRIIEENCKEAFDLLKLETMITS